jgi:ribulose-phosphate 3-epimerase
MTIIIEPSILAADFSRLGDQAREAEAAGARAIQIDVMDGHFVPNITFGPGVVQALRPLVAMTLDVHLMVQNPDPYLQIFADGGANRLIVHQEACPHLHRTLDTIHKLGLQAGIAINPATPINVLEEVLDVVDVVQVMTVNPGFGGQQFIPSQLRKIERLNQLLMKNHSNVVIAVDGGIDVRTAPLAVQAGATILVAGSSVYNHQATVLQNIRALEVSLSQVIASD